MNKSKIKIGGSVEPTTIYERVISVGYNCNLGSCMGVKLHEGLRNSRLACLLSNWEDVLLKKTDIANRPV